MARRAEPRDPLRRVDRQPHPTASRGAARQETAAQELPLDGQTPASTASAVGPARPQRLTSCHSGKSHYLVLSVTLPIALHHPPMPPVELSASLAVPVLQAQLRAELARRCPALREVEAIGIGQQRAYERVEEYFSRYLSDFSAL